MMTVNAEPLKLGTLSIFSEKALAIFHKSCVLTTLSDEKEIAAELTSSPTEPVKVILPVPSGTE